MTLDKNSIVKVFRYIWLIFSLLLLLFILNKGIYTKRDLKYHLDFSQSLSRDIRGWYPESRLTPVFDRLEGQTFDILGEPIYMKIYTPVDFDMMTIEGSFYFDEATEINIGLRQKDGSWQWKNIANNNFSLTFALADALTKNNQLEIILSLPNISDTSVVSLINNWQIILKR
ncbi:hypothetical protein KKH39_04320 [Patescibacteria group bacterium]|nr:hypothetical protein [Patescibacteria group bacterium]